LCHVHGTEEEWLIENNQKCMKEDIVCPLGLCDGSGEIDCMDTVFAGEPHTALIGSRRCEHLSEEDDFSGATEGDR
jgi:hypothetical protein